jgi:phage terminase large subunit-like protein
MVGRGGSKTRRGGSWSVAASPGTGPAGVPDTIGLLGNTRENRARDVLVGSS